MDDRRKIGEGNRLRDDDDDNADTETVDILHLILGDAAVVRTIKFHLKQEDLIIVNATLAIICEITLHSDYVEEYSMEED